MTDDHARRRARLAAALVAAGLDAALVTRAVHVRYLTGLLSSNAACLVFPDERIVLATDSRYAAGASTACPDAEILTERRVAPALVARAAGTVGRLGIERDHVTMSVGDALADVADGRLELVGLDDAITALRATKDAVEVALVEQACTISAQALAALLDGPILGRTEAAIARDLESRMLLAGADGLAFATIVASGPHGAVPHHAPTDRPVERGDLVTIDFGATVAGYHADCTRTVSAGPPADWQCEIHAVVAAAQQAGLAALGPGERPATCDAAARSVIEQAGFGESFVHGLGHGVGLEIHEAPWLTGAGDPAARLPRRTTVTVEPGIYLPGSGGVRIEDTTDVSTSGVRVLTDLTRELLDVTA